MAVNSQHPEGETSDSPASQAQTRRAEHAADTRVALIAAARRLFAAYGFDGTGTEQIVAEARVTRGALYHHFRDKADLFRAAMAEAAADVALRLTDEQLAAEAASPLDDIREGVSAFLDVCVGGDFQRIVLVDGPRVLGADAWEDLVDRYGRGLLEEWLSRAAATGDLDAVPVRALARLLIAMLTEASLAIARADDPASTRADLGAVLDRMLTGLRPRLVEPTGGLYPEFVANAGGRDPGKASRPVKIMLLEQRPGAVDDQVGNGQIEGDEVVVGGTDGRQCRHGVALLFGVGIERTR